MKTFAADTGTGEVLFEAESKEEAEEICRAEDWRLKGEVHENEKLQQL